MSEGNTLNCKYCSKSPAYTNVSPTTYMDGDAICRHCQDLEIKAHTLGHKQARRMVLLNLNTFISEHFDTEVSKIS